MVGLGSEDSLEGARQFARETGAGRGSLRMLWDESGRGWDDLGIQSRPMAVLLDRRGGLVKRWYGMFDEGEALRLAGAA